MYEENLKQDKIINEQAQTIKALEDKLGKQGKRILQIEAILNKSQ